MSKVLHVVSNGALWTARILIAGDRYGLNDALTLKGDPQVEFYDRRFMHTQYGQFVTRYDAKSLMNKSWPHGLNLQCDIPSWRIDAEAMTEIVAWLKENVQPAIKIDAADYTSLYPSDTVLAGTPLLIEKGRYGVAENRSVNGTTHVKVTHQYRPASGAYEYVGPTFELFSNIHLLYKRDGAGPV